MVLVALSLGQLDLRSLLRATATCRRWHGALSSPHTWQHLTVHIEDDASPVRICEFAFPPAPLSTLRPVHAAPVDDSSAQPPPLWPLDACLPSILPVRHLLINTDNESFLPSFTFLSLLTSLRTLTIHLTLPRYRSLRPSLSSLHLPSLSSFTVLLDVRFKDLSSTLEDELFTLPSHLPGQLHLHLRSFNGRWEDHWVDAVRRWTRLDGFDLSMAQWQCLSEDHLVLLLQGDEADGEGARRSRYLRLKALSLCGQSHLYAESLAAMTPVLSSLTALDLTNCMGLDQHALPCLSHLPHLRTLHLTLHERMPDSALHAFLASTPQLARLSLSAKSIDRRQTVYHHPVTLPLPAPYVAHLIVHPGVRLRAVEGGGGMVGLRAFEWEGGGEEGVVAWVMSRPEMREVRMRVAWEEWEEEAKAQEPSTRPRWEEMNDALRALACSGAAPHLRVVRTNAREGRTKAWRRLAPHVFFSVAEERAAGESPDWEGRMGLTDGQEAGEEGTRAEDAMAFADAEDDMK